MQDSASAIHFWLCCIATVLNQLRSCSWAIPDCARAALICSSGTLLLSLFYAGTIFPSAFTVAPLLSLEFGRGSRISVGMCVRVRQTCRDIEVCYMMIPQLATANTLGKCCAISLWTLRAVWGSMGAATHLGLRKHFGNMTTVRLIALYV